MPFDPSDLAPIHDYWADDPAYAGVSHGTYMASLNDLGSGGDDVASKSTNAFQLLRSTLNGKSVFTLHGGTGGDVTFGVALPQPCDIVAVIKTANFTYNGTHNPINLGPSGTGLRLGWTADGGAGHRGRWEANAGSTVQQPQDGRIIEQDANVIHVRLDGADSYVAVDGAILFSGNLGSDDIDGLTLFDGSGSYYARLMFFDYHLSGTELGQLYEFFDAEYAAPDWAPQRYQVLLVTPSNPPNQDSSADRLRYTIEKRGHHVTLVASASLGTENLLLYSAVAYAGNYADRSTNGPILRAAVDAGVPLWLTLWENGMGGLGSSYTDSVACALDLISEVTAYSSFGWGNVTTQTSHPITDFLGTPPQTIASKESVSGNFAYIDAADDAVGTLLVKLSTFEEVYAIAKGTADLSAVALNAKIVLSGIDFTGGDEYFTRLGYQLFQHEIDWLLDAINPPVLNTVTGGLRLLTPRFGELIDPDAGDVTFEWTDRPGRTATVYVTADITAPAVAWVEIGSTGLGVTTLAVDMSSRALYPEGIWYSWKIVWDDAEVWTHPGFKLVPGVASASYGQFVATGAAAEEHVFIPWDPTPVTNEGAKVASFLWDQTDSFWKPSGAHHEYNGLAASVLEGNQSPALQVPPNLPTGFKHYEISAWMRVGALTSPYFGQSTKYWAAEGQGCGVGLYAAGTGTGAKGILASAFLSNIYPLAPNEGQTNVVYFDVTRSEGGALEAPTVPRTLTAWAYPSPIALDDWLIPLRLVVTQVSPTRALIQAGLGGFGGSPYWLVDEGVDFDFGAVGTDAGWALFKIFGNEDAGGFRDMYSLSITASDSRLSPLTAEPCALHLIVYEADRSTVAWEVSTDPNVALPYLVEPDEYGSQEVDFLQGSASIGEVVVEVIDPWTVAGDQDSGWLTERLADAQGFGALMGRRGRLLRYIDATIGWVVIADGDIGSIELSETFASYRFPIRDTRERERKSRAFLHGSTTSMMPRGVLIRGAGPFALGTTIPNVEDFPLVARYEVTAWPEFNGYFNLTFHQWTGGDPDTQRVIALPAVEEAGKGIIDDAGIQILTTWHKFPNAVVWWRPRFGGTNDWVLLRPAFSKQIFGAMDAESNVFDIVDATYQGETVRAVRGIYGVPLGYNARTPNVGDTVEVMVQYIGPTSEDFPFHWYGPLGDFIQAAYDGEFSPRQQSAPPPTYWDEYDPGVIVPTGIRYDAAALALMTETAMVRVTEPVDELRDWLEKHAYAPSGWAPCIDLDGAVSPLHQSRPATWGNLTTIDDSVAEAEPGWSHSPDVINVVRFQYPRLWNTPVDANGLPIGTVDALVTQEVEVLLASTAGNLASLITQGDLLASISPSVAQFGERERVFEALAFCADEAVGIPFVAANEQGFILALERADNVFARFGFGPQLVTVNCRRAVTATLRPGDWVILTPSWMPEFATRRRNMDRLAQVVAVDDLDCAWRRFTFELDIARSFPGSSGTGPGGAIGTVTSTPKLSSGAGPGGASGAATVVESPTGGHASGAGPGGSGGIAGPPT